jgi:hypothetical protein
LKVLLVFTLLDPYECRLLPINGNAGASKVVTKRFRAGLAGSERECLLLESTPKPKSADEFLITPLVGALQIVEELTAMVDHP